MFKRKFRKFKAFKVQKDQKQWKPGNDQDMKQRQVRLAQRREWNLIKGRKGTWGYEWDRRKAEELEGKTGTQMKSNRDTDREKEDREKEKVIIKKNIDAWLGYLFIMLHDWPGVDFCRSEKTTGERTDEQHHLLSVSPGWTRYLSWQSTFLLYKDHCQMKHGVVSMF